MRAAAPLLAILLLLAGCASPPAAPTTAPLTATGTGTSANPSVCANCTRTPVAATLAIDWSGKLGEQAIACAPQPLGCHTFSQDAASSHTDSLAAGNLTAVRLEMAWTATTPATQTLTLGVMVMGCPTCPAPFANEVSGASPIVVDLKDLHVALNGTQVLHLYVYNPAGNVEQDPGYAYATGDQAFTVKGGATLLQDRGRH
ncbi:MAG: hypothetical protein QOG31_315 [Thermoplasmata archaeon]|jgi:hypothetical protein|nr:hypothetical protein [Thermoplasmata archaeon]